MKTVKPFFERDSFQFSWNKKKLNYTTYRGSCFRELNELRKPSLADPEILRFFRYMKAAKDGQDGRECQAYGGCPSLTTHQASPAMLTTFNDINKLVLARKLNWFPNLFTHVLELTILCIGKAIQIWLKKLQPHVGI